MNEQRIPKIIHYCWFGGGAKPRLVQECIASWRKYLPDYEIMEWNESNFDVERLPYVREAYARRKFAFVSDVARLHALYEHGGVYMDTDVEVLRPLDGILGCEGVFGVECNEYSTLVATHFIASVRGHEYVRELLSDYDGIHFVKPDGTLDLTTNPSRITDHTRRYGLRAVNERQDLCGFTFLPSEYLSPKSWYTGQLDITPRTLVIHHFAGSWMSPYVRFKLRVHELIGPAATRLVAGVKNRLLGKTGTR